MVEEVEEGNRLSPLETVSMESKPLQKADTPKIAPTKWKQIVSKIGSKRGTRSHTVAKGILEDILHAIDIEKSLIVQAKYIYGGRKLEKGKTAKEVEFAGDEVGLIF